MACTRSFECLKNHYCLHLSPFDIKCIHSLFLKWPRAVNLSIINTRKSLLISMHFSPFQINTHLLKLFFIRAANGHLECQKFNKIVAVVPLNYGDQCYSAHSHSEHLRSQKRKHTIQKFLFRGYN